MRRKIEIAQVDDRPYPRAEWVAVQKGATNFSRTAFARVTVTARTAKTVKFAERPSELGCVSQVNVPNPRIVFCATEQEARALAAKWRREEAAMLREQAAELDRWAERVEAGDTPEPWSNRFEEDEAERLEGYDE